MENTNQPETETQKRRTRKKIRRLGQADVVENSNSFIRRLYNTAKRLLAYSLLLILALAVLLGHHYTQNEPKNSGLLKNFVKSYQKNYNQIVHDQPDYCERKMDVQGLFARVRHKQILHQNDSLQKLQLHLSNETTNHRGIALVGSSGVGKTLFAGALAENFPWPENVHIYAWNTFVNDEYGKFDILRSFAERLSDCGRNLIIIDNLKPDDHEIIPKLYEYLNNVDENATKRINILFIFNLNSMLIEDPIYNQQFEMLQSLPATETVNFRTFSSEDLEDCIKREAQIENIVLSEDNIKDIIESINATHSGCKNIHTKVMILGNRN